MAVEIHGILLAAGTGDRFGGNLPKQFFPIGGKPLLHHALRALLHCGRLASLTVVLPPDFMDFPLPTHPLLTPAVRGDSMRHLSVRNALAAVDSPHVLIHDAVRPLVSTDLIGAVCHALKDCDAVTPLSPIADALVTLPDLHSTDRRRHGTLQTPQGFRTEVLREAFAKFSGDWVPASEFDLVRRAVPTARWGTVPGHPLNLKVTARADIFPVEFLLNRWPPGPDSP
jgi:2-C-methyl-D-erythritol 4-phosphate cytidylyltransferase